MDQLVFQSTPRRRKGAPWSRSGCLTCKRRRKRCDESKPTCGNCARLGRTCEGYESIWTEPLNPSAGVFQPGARKRRRISSSSPSPHQDPGASPTSTLPGTPASCSFDNEGLDRPGSATNEPEGPDQSLALMDISSPGAIPRSYGYPSQLSSTEMHYLQYHVEQGSKLLANLETDENPLRALIIPKALSSPLLLKAVCAVSAMHLTNRSHDSLRTSTTAADYYAQALRGLRTTLAEQPSSTFRDDTMLAVAFLCKYEIVRGSVKQWTVHLDALQKLVISRGGLASIDKETAEFLSGMFMYASNMAKITNRRQFGALTAGSDNVSITKLDIYVGYTEELIKICARIADLPSLGADRLAVGLEISAIDESLQNRNRSTRQYIIPKGTTAATLARLQMVADCFYDAAYIYLHSTLERIAQGPSRIPPAAMAAWSSLISVSKSTALHHCLFRIRSCPLDHHVEYSALTFPLFIAGCESRDPEEREIIIQALGVLEENFGIGNVKRARELLGVLWEGDGEMHWLDVLEELQWDLILA